MNQESLDPLETVPTRIQNLGDAKITSPTLNELLGNAVPQFVSDDERVMINIKLTEAEAMIAHGLTPPAFELAGPRQRIYFDAS